MPLNGGVKTAEIGRIASKHVKVPPASRKTPSSPGSERGSVADKSERKFLRRSNNKSPINNMNHCEEQERPQSEPEEMETQEGEALASPLKKHKFSDRFLCKEKS